MFKYILAPAAGTESDISVFRTAFGVARLHGPLLVFLHIRQDLQNLILPLASPEFGGGAGPGEYIAPRAANGGTAGADGALRKAAARIGLAATAWHSAADDPAGTATAVWPSGCDERHEGSSDDNPLPTRR